MGVAVIAEIVATLLVIARYLRSNPELAERLVNGLVRLIEHRNEYVANVEASRALAAGIAAARANAVQEYVRAEEAKTPKIEPL